MKQFFLILLFGILARTAAADAQNPDDKIFSGIQVHEININFSQPAYWDSLIYFFNRGDEHYIPARVTINGIVYDSIGVRLKGNSSFTHPNNTRSADDYLVTLEPRATSRPPHPSGPS